MSAPVFDPALFGLTDQDPLADLQAASRIYNKVVAHVAEHYITVGEQAGLEEAIHTLTRSRHE